MPPTQQVLRSMRRTEIILGSLRFMRTGTPIRGLAALINRPGITLTPWLHPLLLCVLSFNSSSLTNPSFQEREADLFWGRASGAVCFGTASGCQSQETMGSERQEGEFSMQNFPA